MEDEATRETQVEHKKEADSGKRSDTSRDQHQYTEPGHNNSVRVTPRVTQAAPSAPKADPRSHTSDLWGLGYRARCSVGPGPPQQAGAPRLPPLP